MKQVLQYAGALALCALFSCSTMATKNPQKEKMEQLDRVLVSPHVAATANRYDEQFGQSAFRSGVIQTGQRAWDEAGQDLHPGQAMDLFIFINTDAMKAALPEMRSVCDANQDQRCVAVFEAKESLQDRERCAGNDSTACLKLAFAFQRKGVTWAALDYAQSACLNRDQRGCDLYSQFTQEREHQAQLRDEYQAQRQQQSLMMLQMQNQSDHKIINGLQGFSNTLNGPAQPAPAQPVHCTTRQRPSLTGDAIVDTECR